MRNAIGLIETVGLAAAIDAADTAVKSANVELLGMEFTKGDGMVVVKIEGDIGAVNAGIESARQSAGRIGKVFSYKVIPRPSSEIELFFPEDIPINDLEEINEERSEAAVVEDTVQLSEEIIQTEGLSAIEETLEETDETEAVEIESELETETKTICNICHDPRCTRKKGALHMMCLHYLD